MNNNISQSVEYIFLDCISKNQQSNLDTVYIEGVYLKVKFDIDKLNHYNTDISEILENIHTNFKINIGGGWSFLNFCLDKNSEQWTDLHHIADKLLVLGLATKKISYLLPKEFWKEMPGGLPYIVIY